MVKVFLTNANKCTGCRLCELICSLRSIGAFKPSASRIRIKLNTKEGTAEPLICQQCETCSCIEVCGAGAVSKDKKTGVIVIDNSKCTGCKECIFSCPYSAVSFEESTKGAAIVCDRCGGQPECIKFCFPGALGWVDRVTHRQTQSALRKLI